MFLFGGLVGPFDPSLGLWRIGMDGPDVEGPEGPGELGQLSLVIRVIHQEDAVLVGVEGDRLAMPGQVSTQGLGGLGGCDAQGHQLAAGIADEHNQGAAQTAILEPVMQ